MLTTTYASTHWLDLHVWFVNESFVNKSFWDGSLQWIGLIRLNDLFMNPADLVLEFNWLNDLHVWHLNESFFWVRNEWVEPL